MSFFLSVPGGNTISIRYNNPNYEYKSTDQVDPTAWNIFSFPFQPVNTNTSLGFLNVEFTSSIPINGNIQYFICGSSYIQFGSKSLNLDGSRADIIISGIINYPGLIQNGDQTTPGYNNIHIFNINFISSGGSTLNQSGGWIGQSYFGTGATNNFIVNCSSNGIISESSGGIVGLNSGGGPTSSLYLSGCSSSGSIGTNAGGIVGQYAGGSGGFVQCNNCWSKGTISEGAGGIIGRNSGFFGGNVTAETCYSEGNMNNVNGGSGGIFGAEADRSAAVSCYSKGEILSSSGGIFGSFAGIAGGLTTATNCYSNGSYPTASPQGIYGLFIQNGSNPNGTNCYAANASWDSNAANAALTGTPTTNQVVGTTWAATQVSPNYELNNMGHSPYTISIITSNNSLTKTHNISVNAGDSSPPAIIPGKTYNILQKSGGDSASYGTISIDVITGTISTTTATKSGTYTLYIRNTGSYNITQANLNVIGAPEPGPEPVPNVPICFPAGTPILTDQGEISIDKIDTKKHTIGGKEIVSIVESIPLDSYLICIEKHSINHNVPSRRTIISKDHKIMYRGKLVRAEYFIEFTPTAYKISYNKERLYNILLKDYSTMSVNNLIVETLNPNNILAKIYSGNYTQKQKNILINMVNKKYADDRKKMVISRNISIP